MPSNEHSAKPWYRYGWTWGLMLGPAIVLVAGAITTVIAVRSDDGLVARDYYKRGLMINKTLPKEGSGTGPAAPAGTVCAAGAGPRPAAGEQPCRND